MTDEAVEAVAKALYAADINPEDRSWDRAHRDMREEYRFRARTAIAAYEAAREPDPAMKAAVNALLEAGDELSFASQISGGVAGRDERLVETIDGWTKAKEKSRQLRRIAWFEPTASASYFEHRFNPDGLAREMAALEQETTAEQFIQAAIDQSPEPLQRLGEYLTEVLDEDEWPTAERLLLALAAPPAVSEEAP